MTYSPTNLCSTIGAVGLNFSVRDGKRWIPNAINRLNKGPIYTYMYRTFEKSNLETLRKLSWSHIIMNLCRAPGGIAQGWWRFVLLLCTAWRKAFGQLVLLDWAHCCVYICSLSTSWSTTTLMRKSNLVVGFALRCFQRLSRPDADTQRCSWRNNWYTGGRSITVLSY